MVNAWADVTAGELASCSTHAAFVVLVVVLILLHVARVLHVAIRVPAESDKHE